jgi:REP element-mobilizing transposase RayT
VSQSLSKVYLHIIFSTKDRFKYIDRQIEAEVYKYMAGILRNMECTAIKIGGMSDHIHILNSLSRTITQSKMIGLLKKDSSKWLKTKGNKFRNFHWQNGYGVFSISESKLTLLSNYIENQQEHHKKKSFKDEFREFINKYKIEYDERYLWD